MNYRFAPNRSVEEAITHVREVFAGCEVEIADQAPGALPGLSHPAAQAFLKATGATVAPKFGWTDVARFSAMGTPAVNYGPGDPSIAHSQGEFVNIEELTSVATNLRRWLTEQGSPIHGGLEP